MEVKGRVVAGKTPDTQGNEGVRPLFAAWLPPFADLGATTVTLANTGGTDHLPYDEIRRATCPPPVSKLKTGSPLIPAKQG